VQDASTLIAVMVGSDDVQVIKTCPHTASGMDTHFCVCSGFIMQQY